MRVVYIAHPIGNDVARNIRRVELIVEQLLKLRGAAFPVAPYLDACRYLDDSHPGDRDRAFEVNRRYFTGRIVDELWVCGELSPGVRTEIEWAVFECIPVQYDPLPVWLKEALPHV